MASLPRASFGRIKRQMRAAALARIDEAVRNQNDPILDTWLTAETASASAEVLSRSKQSE